MSNKLEGSCPFLPTAQACDACIYIQHDIRYTYILMYIYVKNLFVVEFVR